MNRAARASWLLGLLGILAVPDLPVTIHRPPATPPSRSSCCCTLWGAEARVDVESLDQAVAELFGQHGLGTAVVDSFSTADARRQVLEFLTAHGLIADRARR